MSKFLSKQWFSDVEKVAAEVGELNIADGLDLALNVSVVDAEDGPCDFCIDRAVIVKGHSDNSPTKLTMTSELAFRIFLERDTSAGMEGLMAGEILVEGDMDILIAMQTAEISAQQEIYEDKVLDLTEA